MTVPFSFTDAQGDELRVVPTLAFAGGACLIAEHGVNVPPHKLAEVVSAMYEAAGQPVPDLPDIPDPALLTELAMDLHAASHGDCIDPAATTDKDKQMASHLLRLGWRKS